MLSCAPQLVLLPFAASRVSWAAGPAYGPTQSDEAACQHLVEGGLGSPFLVPSPVSSRTYRICCTIFLLPCPYRIVSCLLERQDPQHCPAGRSALDVKVAIPLLCTVQSRRGMRSHREAQRATSQVHRHHHQQRHNQTTPFLSPSPGNPRKLASGQGGLECGQIRFVPQKVSTSRRFLVLVASVTCHLMPNATMSTWEVPVSCFPSAPVRTQRSTRSRSWALHPWACGGLMNTIYSAPNHLHERHKSPYSTYLLVCRAQNRTQARSGRGSQLCITSYISVRYPPQRPGPWPTVASRFRHSSKRRPFLDPSGPGRWGQECSAATDMGMGPWGSGEG